MNIKETLYEVLTKDDDLTALLANGADGIHKDVSPEAGNYPIIVYNLISDVPILFTDDTEALHKTSIQISILTRNGGYENIARAINRAMQKIGFSRDYSNEIYEDDKKIKVMRYVIGLEEE